MKAIEEVIRYYSEIANEYDSSAGYLDMETEKMRKAMKHRHQTFLKGKDVLEIACGTGYWTNVIAKTAKSVFATDVNQKMISIAQKKYNSLKNVTFQVCDAYLLKNITGNFNGAYAHWWWSHIPISKIKKFLLNLHKKLQPGSSVLFSDHLPTYLNKQMMVLQNEDGDRIEKRTPSGGEEYLVIKNFPTRKEMQNYLSGLAEKIDFQEYDRYWELKYFVMK